MNKITYMDRIKALDTELANAQKEEMDYAALRNLFQVAGKQSKAMIGYLNKCEEEGMSLEQSQFELEGFMLGEEE